MAEHIHSLILGIVLAPIIGSLIAGFFGKLIGRRWSHSVTIVGVAIAFALVLCVAKIIFIDGAGPFNFNVYTWVHSGAYTFHVGFLVDRLSAAMMLLVTFVSLLVQVLFLQVINY